jgi:ribonucleoside-diphosphate reductase alpha chain
MTNVSTYGSRRAQLPSRRAHWLYRFECDGQTYTGGIGRFPDGCIAEVFINGAKVGTAAETSAQDAAIVASLALQHGCPVETLRHALARAGGSSGPLVTLFNIALEQT